MKPHRTPLLANAVTGSVRAPARGPAVPSAAYAAHTLAPDDGDPRLTNSRQSTALRERLSQTRARIARAHAERPPQINLDWDAEEPLTRVYQGEKLPLPRSTNTPEPDYADPPAQHAHPAPAEHTNDAWYSDLHAHSAPAGARPPGAERGRARAEQALTAHVHVPVATQSQPAQILAPHAAEPPPTAATQRQRPTLAVTSTVNTVRERLGDAYAGIDRSDAALR